MTDLYLPPVSAALVANGVTEWATLAVIDDSEEWAKRLLDAARVPHLPSPGERVAIWATDEKVEPPFAVSQHLSVRTLYGHTALVDLRGYSQFPDPDNPTLVAVLRPAELHAHATVADVLPIDDDLAPMLAASPLGNEGAIHRNSVDSTLTLWREMSDGIECWQQDTDISDQLPYCDWTPGRQAVRFTDIEEAP